MSDELKKNILSAGHWLRILYMVFFAVVCWVMGIVMTVLVVAQALFSLLTGKDNDNLRHLGGSLSRYFYEILLFLTYKSEHKPFPFAPFPETAGAARPEPGDAPREATGEDVFAGAGETGGDGGRSAEEFGADATAEPPVTPAPSGSEAGEGAPPAPGTARPGEGPKPATDGVGGDQPGGGTDPERGP